MRKGPSGAISSFRGEPGVCAGGHHLSQSPSGKKSRASGVFLVPRIVTLVCRLASCLRVCPSRGRGTVRMRRKSEWESLKAWRKRGCCLGLTPSWPFSKSLWAFQHLLCEWRHVVGERPHPQAFCKAHRGQKHTKELGPPRVPNHSTPQPL